MIKPGWKSTEFIKTTVTMVVGFLVGTGVIEPLHLKYASSEITNVAEIVIRVVGFVSMTAANVSYNSSRGKAKGNNNAG